MWHSKRLWSVGNVATAEELAEKLTNHTHCLCTGFRCGGYLFLNDSLSEDGSAEYAVLKPLDDGTYRQIESITFGWTTPVVALKLILNTLAGDFDGATYAKVVEPRLEEATEHERCGYCA